MTIAEVSAAKYVGRSIARLDGPAKTAGQARFSAEHFYPNLAYAALVYATIARGRIITIDTSEARAVAGVIEVLTHENAPAMKPPGKLNLLDMSSIAISTSVNYLATDEVHRNGQPIAVPRRWSDRSTSNCPLLWISSPRCPTRFPTRAYRSSLAQPTRATRALRWPRRRCRWIWSSAHPSTRTTPSSRTRRRQSGTVTS
jgi:hypothetical protein